MGDVDGGQVDYTKTYAYTSLVTWTKYEYKRLVRKMSPTRRREHDFAEWAEKWLKRKHDITFSLHEPRDLSRREEVVAKALDELTEWKNSGKLDVDPTKSG